MRKVLTIMVLLSTTVILGSSIIKTTTKKMHRLQYKTATQYTYEKNNFTGNESTL